MEIKTTIILEIKGTKLELTIDELIELQRTINEIRGWYNTGLSSVTYLPCQCTKYPAPNITWISSDGTMAK